jgi:hypothetical protein
VTFVKKNGRPLCFYEEDMKKLYFIKHRRWYDVDARVDTKKGYFTYDSQKKEFFLLKCELNSETVVYTYTYFKTDHWDKKIRFDSSECKERLHNLKDFETAGKERTVTNFEFLEFEIDQDINLLFFVSPAYVLGLVYNSRNGQ